MLKVEWDGYQKEVSVNKQIQVVPAYAEANEAVEVLSADGKRLRKVSSRSRRTPVTVRRGNRHNGTADTPEKKKKRSNCMERVRFRANTFHFMLHLMLMVPLYVKHQFINLWQHSVRAEVWEDFPKDAVLIEMDFAENFTIVVQDEQQAGHWVHKQVTMLICIVRYHNSDGKTIVKSFVYLSDDPHHDTWFVQHVLPLILKELPGSMGKQFKRVWISTDGAPSHFKSRFTIFFLLKLAAKLQHVQIWWDFCAPSHGKGKCFYEELVVYSVCMHLHILNFILVSRTGPWDGIGACLKNYIRLMIRTGVHLKNPDARSIFEFLVSPLSKFSRPTFARGLNNALDSIEIMWVDQTAVDRCVSD